MEGSQVYEAIKANDAELLQSALADDNTDANQRDSDGRSFLHHAVLTGADSAVLEALLGKVDLGVRDKDGNTVLDLILAGSYPDAVQDAVEAKVRDLILSGQEEGRREAERLLLTGWTHWPLSLEEARDKSEEAAQFLQTLLQLKDKASEVHRAVQDGRTKDLKGLLDRKLLACAADPLGMPPLHKAVLYQHQDMVQYLVTEFTDTLNAKDSMERTALHYAAALADENKLYNILKDAGADDSIKDMSGHSPADYLSSPHLMPTSDLLKKLEENSHRTDTQQQQAAAPDAGQESAPAQEAGSQQQTQEANPQPREEEKEQVQEGGSQQVQEEGSQRLPQDDAQPEVSQETAKPDTSLTQLPAPQHPPQVNMYIGNLQQRREPPPSTVDGKYVAEHLGNALTLALAEIVEKRPWDPIEYLAQWLYKHRQNLDHNELQKQLLNDIRREESAAQEEADNLMKQKEEEKRIKAEVERQRQQEDSARKQREQEELQRQAKEALLAQAPQLPTVTEEDVDDSLHRARDHNGQTELHVLAAQSGADLVTLINLGYNIADRDANNKTPRDIAEEKGVAENVEAIDMYVSNLLEQEKVETLSQLIVDGYDKLDAVLSKVSTDGLPQTVTDFVNSIPQLQERVESVMTAVTSGVLRDVETALDSKSLALARDKHGRSPLHLALLAGHQDIARHIITNYPHTVKARDNLNRTPLHYAAALSEPLSELLKENGADVNAKDVKQHSPAYYSEEKEDILMLKDTLSLKSPADTEAPSQVQEDEQETESAE